MSELLPILVALTPEAEAALGAPKQVLNRFPFRIGRDSRADHSGGLFSRERRNAAMEPNNDLYVKDTGRLKNVSREHLQIEQRDDGGYRVLDRGSACGTIVGNTRIGGHRQRQAQPLEDGNVIILGTSESPFVLKFVLVDTSG